MIKSRDQKSSGSARFIYVGELFSLTKDGTTRYGLMRGPYGGRYFPPKREEGETYDLVESFGFYPLEEVSEWMGRKRKEYLISPELDPPELQLSSL